MKIEVINIKKYEGGDYIYIGRPGKYGNPYSSKEGTLAEFKVDTKKESLEMFEKYLNKNDHLVLDLIEDLKSKGVTKIGCFCKPSKCHGDIYLKRINEKKLFSII